MFDVGWSEMAIIAVIVLVVLGPKELPHALKTVSHWMRAARKMGAEFQSGVNEIVRDAELDDARKQLQGISKHTIEKKIEKAIDPGGDLKKAINEAEVAAKAVESETPAPAPAVLPPAVSVAESAPKSAAEESAPATSAQPIPAPLSAPPAAHVPASVPAGSTPSVERSADTGDAQASIAERN